MKINLVSKNIPFLLKERQYKDFKILLHKWKIPYFKKGILEEVSVSFPIRHLLKDKNICLLKNIYDG